MEFIDQPEDMEKKIHKTSLFAIFEISSTLLPLLEPHTEKKE
jgi:hypothetical protein